MNSEHILRSAQTISLCASALIVAAGTAGVSSTSTRTGTAYDEAGALLASNGSVTAVERAAVAPRFHIDAFLADDVLPMPEHPPIDQIQAMEMPNTDLWGDIDGLPGNPVEYDQRTGEIIEYDAPIWANRSDGEARGGGFVGADGAVGYEDMFPGRGFGTMNQINDGSLTANPWRMNCKLVMEFTDAGDGTRTYRVCSGAMQDAEVVLTAGHCVYLRDNDSTGQDYGYATRVWVYPGWDGDGLTLGNPGVIDNYGWAVSTGVVAWSAYTQDGDFDADIGLVRLDRAVGMLTGWYAWRSSPWDTCNTLGLTFHNASFPAEGCGQTGLHNGRDMYYWFGSFDSCQGPNQLRINTSPGCFTALWGGQSGSNAYDIDGDTRFAHAVASNSNRSSIGQYAKLWTGAREYMNDTWKPSARGTALDLQALQVRVTPTTILAGNSTDTATAQVPNPTNNNPGSATYGFNMYLSANNNISPSDVLLSDRQYTFDYAAMQNVNLNTGNVTIPKNTASGTYWVGMILDNGVDANNSNNDSDLWDAQQITVTGFADIVANSCSAPSGTRFHGDTISVSYNVENEGGDPSNSVTLDFYASTNTDISGGDTFLGSINIGTFLGSESKSGSVNLTIPSNILGNYYIGYIASASDDFFGGQANEAVDSVALNIDGRADLTANFIDALDNTVGVGGTTDVQYFIGNQGTVSSGTYDVDIYASTNTIISTGDTLLGSIARPSLGVGASVTRTSSVNVPLFMAPGEYYVGMIVSGGRNETATSNNSAFDSRIFRITDCLVDFDNNGLYDLVDIGTFVNGFTGQQPVGDLNNDGIWDLNDITIFVNAFTGGCP